MIEVEILIGNVKFYSMNNVIATVISFSGHKILFKFLLLGLDKYIML